MQYTIQYSFTLNDQEHTGTSSVEASSEEEAIGILMDGVGRVSENFKIVEVVQTTIH
jgi:hypothetical protein